MIHIIHEEQGFSRFGILQKLPGEGKDLLSIRRPERGKGHGEAFRQAAFILHEGEAPITEFAGEERQQLAHKLGFADAAQAGDRQLSTASHELQRLLRLLLPAEKAMRRQRRCTEDALAGGKHLNGLPARAGTAEGINGRGGAVKADAEAVDGRIAGAGGIQRMEREPGKGEPVKEKKGNGRFAGQSLRIVHILAQPVKENGLLVAGGRILKADALQIGVQPHGERPGGILPGLEQLHPGIRHAGEERQIQPGGEGFKPFRHHVGGAGAVEQPAGIAVPILHRVEKGDIGLLRQRILQKGIPEGKQGDPLGARSGKNPPGMHGEIPPGEHAIQGMQSEPGFLRQGFMWEQGSAPPQSLSAFMIRESGSGGQQ